MRFACESVVKQFLTTYRHALITTLKEGGKTQQQIADMLCLTQAAVSNYLKRDAEGEGIPGMDRVIEDLAGRSAEMIEEAGIVPVMDMVCHACKVHRFPDQPLCARHVAEIPSLEAGGCAICSKYLDPSVVAAADERGSILHELIVAARHACALPGFPALVPEVQSNIVLGTATPGKDASDYAAFTGRIARVGGIARPAGAPAFGASTHLARIVMLVRARHPAIRGAMCIRHAKDIDEAMKDAGLNFIHLVDENDGLAIDGELQRAGTTPPDALVFTGVVGLEPLTYLLGTSAGDVIARLRRLLDYRRP